MQHGLGVVGKASKASDRHGKKCDPRASSLVPSHAGSRRMAYPGPHPSRRRRRIHETKDASCPAGCGPANPWTSKPHFEACPRSPELQVSYKMAAGPQQPTIETHARTPRRAWASLRRPLRRRQGKCVSQGPSRRTARYLHGAESSEPGHVAGDSRRGGGGRRNGREAEGIAGDRAKTGLSWSCGAGLAHAPPDAPGRSWSSDPGPR